MSGGMSMIVVDCLYKYGCKMLDGSDTHQMLQSLVEQAEHLLTSTGLCSYILVGGLKYETAIQEQEVIGFY